MNKWTCTACQFVCNDVWPTFCRSALQSGLRARVGGGGVAAAGRFATLFTRFEVTFYDLGVVYRALVRY